MYVSVRHELQINGAIARRCLARHFSCDDRLVLSRSWPTTRLRRTVAGRSGAPTLRRAATFWQAVHHIPRGLNCPDEQRSGCVAKRKTRIERDSMGELEVPDSAFYAAQTQRAVQIFPISGLVMPPRLIR